MGAVTLVSQDRSFLSVMECCSQAFPPGTAHLGSFGDACYHGICGKNSFFTRELEPNMSEHFCSGLEKAK